MALRSFKGSGVMESSCKIFFDWFWLLCWYNVVGVIWFIDMPIPCEGILNWEYGFVCCLVSL